MLFLAVLISLYIFSPSNLVSVLLVFYALRVFAECRQAAGLQRLRSVASRLRIHSVELIAVTDAPIALFYDARINLSRIGSVAHWTGWHAR